MDFLRIESEMNFITLLPKTIRVDEVDDWYQDSTDDLQTYLDQHSVYFTKKSNIIYTTDNPKKELFVKLQQQYYEALPTPPR